MEVPQRQVSNNRMSFIRYKGDYKERKTAPPATVGLMKGTRADRIAEQVEAEALPTVLEEMLFAVYASITCPSCGGPVVHSWSAALDVYALPVEIIEKYSCVDLDCRVTYLHI